MERQISFKDAEGKLFKIDVDIKDKGRFKEFSASGDCGSSSGQCLDSIKPATEFQRRLVEIWHKYHLNGMHSGTEKQELALSNWKERTEGFSYTKDCEYLDSLDSSGKPLSKIEFDKINAKREELNKEIAELLKNKETYEKEFEVQKDKFKTFSGRAWFILKEFQIKEFIQSNVKWKGYKFKTFKRIDNAILELNLNLNEWKLKTLLYDLHPETKEVYQYGCEWLHRDLPLNFEEDLNRICDRIEEQEMLNKKKLENGSWEDIENPKIIALAKSLELFSNEAKEDISDGGNNIYNYAGIDYFVGDKDETHEEAEIYLKDDTYIYQSWVEEQIKIGNASNIKNIDEWANWVIDVDGYGHILNGWDGTEDTQEVNGTIYYVIRR